jgi:hypothetical protein
MSAFDSEYALFESELAAHREDEGGSDTDGDASESDEYSDANDADADAARVCGPALMPEDAEAHTAKEVLGDSGEEKSDGEEEEEIDVGEKERTLGKAAKRKHGTYSDAHPHILQQHTSIYTKWKRIKISVRNPTCQNVRGHAVTHTQRYTNMESSSKHFVIPRFVYISVLFTKECVYYNCKIQLM